MEKILIVDDEMRMRRIYRSLLELEGYHVYEAATATEANEIIKQNHIDLVLLDIKIPDVDGSMLYDIIESFHKEVKVIVSSVYPFDMQRRCVIGASAYYDKSRPVEHLLIKVREVMQHEPVHEYAC